MWKKNDQKQQNSKWLPQVNIVHTEHCRAHYVKTQGGARNPRVGSVIRLDIIQRVLPNGDNTAKIKPDPPFISH